MEWFTGDNVKECVNINVKHFFSYQWVDRLLRFWGLGGDSIEFLLCMLMKVTVAM